MVMKEPQLVTLPDLLDIQRELQQREPIFHQPKFAATRQQFDLMMDESFWEVGASGQRYSRQFVLDIVGSPDTTLTMTSGDARASTAARSRPTISF
jgi:hypothetical protein